LDAPEAVRVGSIEGVRCVGLEESAGGVIPATAEKEAEQILEIEIEKSIQEESQRTQASMPSSQGPLPDLKDAAYFSNQKRYLLLTGDSTKDTVLTFSFFI